MSSADVVVARTIPIVAPCCMNSLFQQGRLFTLGNQVKAPFFPDLKVDYILGV